MEKCSICGRDYPHSCTMQKINDTSCAYCGATNLYSAYEHDGKLYCTDECLRKGKENSDG